MTFNCLSTDATYQVLGFLWFSYVSHSFSVPFCSCLVMSHVFCHVLSCWTFERASHQAKHFFFSVFLCAKGKAFAQGQGKVASCGIPWLPDSTWCEWVKGQTHAKNCKNKRNNIIQYCDIVPCRMFTCSFMFLLFVREMYPWHIFISFHINSFNLL